jgi:hypothetical protein
VAQEAAGGTGTVGGMQGGRRAQGRLTGVQVLAAVAAYNNNKQRNAMTVSSPGSGPPHPHLCWGAGCGSVCCECWWRS